MNKAFGIVTFLMALTALIVAFSHHADTLQNEPVYAHVLATNTLRCAYTSFAPAVTIDPNTKQMSGMMYDAVNEAGKRLGIKIEWVEEVSWGDIAAGLKANRYDAFCTGLWPGANRAKNTLFTNGLFFDAVGVFVRSNDARLSNDPLVLNDPAYTVAYAEGDASEVMAKAIFPKAKKLPLTGMNSVGDFFNQVSSKKADATLNTRIAGAFFMEANPGIMKEVRPQGRPIRVYPITIGLPEGEYGLKKMLDAVIFEMQDDGTVDRIVKRYLGHRRGMLYRLKTDYEPL